MILSHRLRFARTWWDNFDSYTWTYTRGALSKNTLFKLFKNFQDQLLFFKYLSLEVCCPNLCGGSKLRWSYKYLLSFQDLTLWSLWRGRTKERMTHSKLLLCHGLELGINLNGNFNHLLYAIINCVCKFRFLWKLVSLLVLFLMLVFFSSKSKIYEVFNLMFCVNSPYFCLQFVRLLKFKIDSST